MVDTPWGPSESLRERQLPPGPGRSPQEVAENQRERLFGAMVAAVAQRGFAATRLSDLTELSGVSSKAFYELFPDKDACFLATVEAVLGTLPEDADAVGFAEWVAQQPAATRVCLIEAHAGSSEIRGRLEAATAGLEKRARRTMSARGADYPAEMITAYVGALLEIARLRLRRGAEAELPGLFAQLDPLLIESYPPPPEPLRMNIRGHGRDEDALDAADHAERITQALASVAAEEGYAQTTIDQIVRRAGISPSMFYNHFETKEEALLAAIDGAGARIVAGVLPAVRRARDWAEGVQVGIRSLFSQLGARPAAARLLMVEVYAAGPAALDHREEALRPLEAIWLGAYRRHPQTPPILFEAIQGAIYRLARRRLEARGPRALPALAPLGAYLVLAPLLGAEAASRAANAKPRPGSTRVRNPEGVREAAQTPLRHRVYVLLGRRPASARQLAAELEQPEDAISSQLEALERADMIAQIDGAGERREPLYRSNASEIGYQEWARWSLSERQMMSDLIRELIDADLDLSIDSGIFDTRVERVFVRAPLTVDEQGFRELSHLQTRALAEGFEIEARAKERLRKSGEAPIDARQILAAFEMPPTRRAGEPPLARHGRQKKPPR